MADQTPTPNKNTNTNVDFGMEETAKTPSSGAPKVNNYTKDIKAPVSSAPQAAQPAVNPTAGTPTPTPAPSAAQPAKPATPPTPAQPQPGRPGTPPPNRPGAGLPSNPATRRKALLGCMGAFVGTIVILLILSFVFLAQSDPQVQSPIAKLLGVEQASFINGLITFVHTIFVLLALTAFVFTMIGLFKASMAKKDDKVAKKEGLRETMIAGIILLFILLVWVGVYIYLDSKRIKVEGPAQTEIMTEPLDTTNLTAPIEIKFDASNIKLSQFQIVSYNWDFGDKESGTGQITSHIYTDIGTYTVTLNVEGKDKKTGELTTAGTYTIFVSVADVALSASFIAEPETGEAPLTVKFDASASKAPNGNIDKYEWDLNEDGKYDDATGVTTEYEFEKIGIYKVGLKVTTSLGKEGTIEKEITVVEATKPIPVIEIMDNPAKYLVDTEYVFKSDKSTSPSGKITKYEWDFGDGAKVVTTKTASHKYTKTGNYEVTLTLTDDAGKVGESTKILKVENMPGIPVAKMVTDPAMKQTAVSLDGKVPFAVKFDATSSVDPDNNIVDYGWDFNDDGTNEAFGVTTTYTFTSEGTFKVVLTVTDADENTGTANMTVKVSPQGITAVLTADTVDGNIPLTVAFDASASSYPKGQISSYRWDFGDGSAPKLGESSLSHKYTAVGTYTAKVTVIGSDNTTDTASQLISVRELGLQSCFATVFEQGPAPLTTSFDPGCSTGNISKYFWDFGDGQTSTDEKPDHTFTTAGTYKVTLEVSDNDNNISKSEVTITAN